MVNNRDNALSVSVSLDRWKAAAPIWQGLAM